MLQSEALAILKTGRNVFLTGEPGAGKSYTIREYVNWLRSSRVEPSITASTGIAATHIGGITLHSWSGIGIAKSLSPREIKEIAGRDRLAKRIRDTKVLIIDEISMFDGRTLDLVESVCKTIRESDEPFGGLQVIFVGDFFQLPPVNRRDEPAPQFAFASDAWLAAQPTVCYLSEQHRQQDGVFLEVLSALRRGQVTEEHKNILGERQAIDLDPEEYTDMTKLFSHNFDVDKMNTVALNRLDETPRTFRMQGNGAPVLVDQLKRGCLSPESLVLKTGARVMFTKNSLDGAYVNGTTGEIVGFAVDTKFPQVRVRSGRIIQAAPVDWKIEIDGKLLATISQIPLRLAWAMTVHKSQGVSLDAALVDLSSAFAYGQGYVALSRVRTLAGLHLRGLNDRALEVDPVVLAQDRAFRQQSADAKTMLLSVAPNDLAALQQQFILQCGGKMHAGRQPTQDLTVKKSKVKGPKYVETLKLIMDGKTVLEVAELRGLSDKTIFSHLEAAKAVNQLPLNKLEHLISDVIDDLPRIHKAFSRQTTDFLKPVFEEFNGEFSYESLRCARLFMPNQQKSTT